MKKIIKITSLALVLVVMMLCFPACGSSSNNSDNSNKVTTSSKAIFYAKSGAEWQIMRACNLKHLLYTSWGTCTTDENSDGSYIVTLKGKIHGYSDDYKDVSASYTFTAEVYVSTTGDTSVRKVDKSYAGR